MQDHRRGLIGLAQNGERVTRMNPRPLFIDKLIPADYKNDEWDFYRGRILVSIILVSFIYWSLLHIPAAFGANPDNMGLRLFFHGAIVLVQVAQLAGILLFWRWANYAFAAHLNVAIIFFYFSSIAYCAGPDIGSEGYLNLFIIVGMAFMLFQIKTAMIWVLVSFVAHVMYSLVPILGIRWQPIFSADPFKISFFSTLSITLVYGVLSAAFGLFVFLNRRLTAELMNDKVILGKQAREDSLTLLANRRFFDVRLMQLLKERENFALLYFDLNEFKVINDNHGHAVGDAILIQSANRVRDSIRLSDFAARVGGDEFAVILTNIPKPKAIQIAESISSVISQSIMTSAGLISVSASIGVSFYPDQGQDKDDLLGLADRAMYQAKINGGGVCVSQVA